MIQSTRRDRRARAIAEVLALMADAGQPHGENQAVPARNAEGFSDSVTEFCAALDLYAERAARENTKKAH